MAQRVTKNWDVDLKWVAFWPSVFQDINKLPRYSSIDEKEVVMVVLTDFTTDEDAPKRRIHVFGEHNQGLEILPHEMSWSMRVGENDSAFLFLEYIHRNDEFFDLTIGAFDSDGNYLGVWAKDTETLIGVYTDFMGHAYAVRELPFADVRGGYMRVVDASQVTYGDGRPKALPGTFPWEDTSRKMVVYEGEGSEPDSPPE